MITVRPRAFIRQPIRTIALFLSTLIILMNPLTAPMVYGISANDLDSIRNGTPFYDALDTSCYSSSGATILAGNDNIQKAFNFLVQKGLSTIAAAGIVGNLMEESGVNPQLVEAYGNHPEQLSNLIPDDLLYYGQDANKPLQKVAAGYGIAQWTSVGRLDGLRKLAQTEGKADGDLAAQLDYLWQEATTTYQAVLNKVKGATNIKDATQWWMGPNGFENPDPSKAHFDDGPKTNSRLPNAQSVYNSFAGTALAYGNRACGRSTNFTTNFVFYKQCGYAGWVRDGLETQAEEAAALAWTNAPYGNSTVCYAGCGPSAMAMIVTNLTGKKVTPDMTAAYGFAHGTATGGGRDGSDGNVLASIIAGNPQWGPLKATEITPSWDIGKINQVLRSGGLVLAGGHMIDGPPGNINLYQNNGPFSRGGHYVVIRAVTSDGKWLIGNPGGWPDKTEYDPTWIVTHIRMDSDTQHVTWAVTL